MRDRGDGGDPLALLEALARRARQRRRELDLDAVGAAAHRHGKPDSRKTSIMRWFSGRTIGGERVDARRAAASARCASRIVAMPCPCQASATANATSAAGPVATYMPWPDDGAVGARARATSDSAVGRRGAVGGAVEVDAGAEEAQPARLLARVRRERRAGAARLGRRGSDVQCRAVAQDDVGFGDRTATDVASVIVARKLLAVEAEGWALVEHHPWLARAARLAHGDPDQPGRAGEPMIPRPRRTMPTGSTTSDLAPTLTSAVTPRLPVRVHHDDGPAADVGLPGQRLRAGAARGGGPEVRRGGHPGHGARRRGGRSHS